MKHMSSCGDIPLAKKLELIDTVAAYHTSLELDSLDSFYTTGISKTLCAGQTWRTRRSERRDRPKVLGKEELKPLGLWYMYINVILQLSAPGLIPLTFSISFVSTFF